MAWQPGTSLIFFYSDGISDGWRGYTFILNSDTGKVCELKLGGWALKAHWSSDGHYLAIARATEYSHPFIHSTDLTVLDTMTGKLYTLDVLPQNLNGERIVHDLAWAPDNRHLIVVGIPGNGQNGNDLDGLYLVDFMTGQSIDVLPQYNEFFSTGAAWSPDGSKLVIRCPINYVDRLCIISVK